jgi:PhzF family phenazine biosynthesis protein
VPPSLLTALGIGPLQVVKAEKNGFMYHLHVTDSFALDDIQPDFRALSLASVEEGVAGVGVSQRLSGSASDDYHFHSRFFAPAVGIDEDPVTGSSHVLLGPYWEKALKKEGQELKARQGGKARRGELKLKVEGERTKLTGIALEITKGEINVGF